MFIISAVSLVCNLRKVCVNLSPKRYQQKLFASELLCLCHEQAGINWDNLSSIEIRVQKSNHTIFPFYSQLHVSKER